MWPDPFFLNIWKKKSYNITKGNDYTKSNSSHQKVFFFFCLITGQEDIQRNWAYNINFKSINVAYIETMSLHLLVWWKAQSIGLNSKICNKTHNILTIVSPIYYKWTNIFPSITKFIWEDESQKNVNVPKIAVGIYYSIFFFYFMNFYLKKKKKPILCSFWHLTANHLIFMMTISLVNFELCKLKNLCII